MEHVRSESCYKQDNLTKEILEKDHGHFPIIPL